MPPILASNAQVNPNFSATLSDFRHGTCVSSVRLNTDGTTTVTGSASSAPSWYQPAVGTPGTFIWAVFHKTAGTAWDAGLVDGTPYAISTNPSLTWTTGTAVGATVTVTFYGDVGMTVLRGSGIIRVDNEFI